MTPDGSEMAPDSPLYDFMLFLGSLWGHFWVKNGVIFALFVGVGFWDRLLANFYSLVGLFFENIIP